MAKVRFWFHSGYWYFLSLEFILLSNQLVSFSCFVAVQFFSYSRGTSCPLYCIVFLVPFNESSFLSKREGGNVVFSES